MKCQRCKEREANVQIVQQELGKKPQTFMLCDVCAREMGISIPTFSVPVKLNNPFAVMGNAFQTTFGIGTDDLQKRRVTRCSRCNLSFDEFRKSGFLGCADCYEAFGMQLDPVFCRTQMGKKHLGRHLAEKMKPVVKKKPEAEDVGSVDKHFGTLDITSGGMEGEEISAVSEPTRETAVDQHFDVQIMDSSEEATQSKDFDGMKDTGEIESAELLDMERKHRTMLISQKKAELDTAVAREDYLTAAKLRDEIAELKAKGE